MQQTVDDLEEKLATSPILSLPRPEGNPLYKKGACGKLVGCVLLQEQGKGEHQSLGYGNKTLNNAKRKYKTTQNEQLVDIWPMLMLRPYVEASRFISKANHQSFKWIFDMGGPTSKLARWQLCFME